MRELYDIRNFGAVGDGVTDNTKAIKDAIDACKNNGGGTVVVSEGVYLFYPVILYSHVHIRVDAGATLLAGTDPALYPEVEHSDYWNVGFALRHNKRYVFYAEGANDIAIYGKGVIDLNGLAFINTAEPVDKGTGRWHRYSDTEVPGRSIFFVGCKDVRIEDVSLYNTAGAWYTWLLNCENVRVTGITLRSDIRTPNADGIHLGSCRNVVISDCFIDGGDDGIVVRSMQEQFGKGIPSENVTITNCVMHLAKFSSAILLGWTHDYAVRNVTMNNIVVDGAGAVVSICAPDVNFSESKDPPRYPDTPPIPPIAPMQIENVQINNVTATNSGTILQLQIDDGMKVEYIRNIALRNIQAFCTQYPRIECSTHHHVSDITFDNVMIEMSGNGPDMEKLLMNTGETIDYMPGHYPIFDNVDNLFFNNVRFKSTHYKKK